MEENQENKDNDIKTYYQIKFIIVGDRGVGKTNIYYRFTNGSFSNDYQPTVVFDIFSHKIKMGDKLFCLNLWDTEGSEKFRSITKGYFTNSACCILVYDITNEDSFKSINYWVNELRLYSSNKTILLLVGNKFDLNEKRKVNEQQGKTLAFQYEMEFFEASAKTGYNIDEIFNTACQKIYENINKGIYDNESDQGVKICNTYNDFIPNKSFSLRIEKNIYKYDKNNNDKNSIIKKEKKKKCC